MSEALVKVRFVVDGVFHDIAFDKGKSWQVRDLFYIKLDLALGLCRGGTIDDWALTKWGGERVDLDDESDAQIKDGDIIFVGRRGPNEPTERKVCPSSEPQLAQHNWGMWYPYDPMIAGSSVTRGFQYHGSCDNMGCTARRYTKMLVADPNTIQVEVDGEVVQSSPPPSA